MTRIHQRFLSAASMAFCFLSLSIGLFIGPLSYASDQKQKSIDKTEARATNNTVTIISMSDSKLKYCAPVIASDGTAMIKLLKINLQKMQQVKIVWFMDGQEIFEYYVSVGTSPYLDARFLTSMGTRNIGRFNEVGEHIAKVVVKDLSGNILAEDEKSYEIVACNGPSLTFGDPSSQCLGVAPDSIPGNFTGDGGGSTHGFWTDESEAPVSSNIPEGSFNAVNYIPPMLLNPIVNTAGFHFLRLDAKLNSTSNIFVSNTIIFDIQSCASGILDHFDFSTIPSPQAVGVHFNVTITAKDASGNQVRDFDGRVSLTSNLGEVTPTGVKIVDGQATEPVWVYDSGKTFLNCGGHGANGNSNEFLVAGTCKGKIFGKVVDAMGKGIYKADVKLEGSEFSETHQTDTKGEFSFTNIACGTYEITAYKKTSTEEATAWIHNIYVPNVPSKILDDIRLGINADGTQGTPVILVPGMMGSTRFNTLYPNLPKILEPQDLRMYDYASVVGWGNLYNDLIKEFKVFECPWDWRLTCQEAYKKYLIKKIDVALNESSTGKVDIIAHSMGGLVVRAYIQGGDYQDRDDIGKVAMVGTPHLGSCNPYYIWEGGDPKILDDITDSGWKSVLNVNTNVLRFLMQTYGNYWGYLPEKLIPHKKIREFVRLNVPSLRQLIYTESFLEDKSGIRAVTTDGNRNNWLKELNQGNTSYVKPSDRMGAENNGKVQVKLFVGAKDDDTIASVMTLDQDDPDFKNDLYEDGIPKQPMKENVQHGDGDGTVPYDSAIWPLADSWADIERPILEGEHVSLIKTYKDQIIAFLSDDVNSNASVEKSWKTKNAEPSSELSFSIAGSMGLTVTNPKGQQSGIEPNSYNPLKEIPLSKIAFGVGGGGTSITNPAQGEYIVTFFGEAARDFRINIGFSDGETTESEQFRGFCPAVEQTFSVLVEPSNTPRITVIPEAKAPTDLKADPYASGGIKKTQLIWTVTGEKDITSYNIYSVADLEPYFSKVATVASRANSYNAEDVWSSASSITAMTYAVTAVKSDGTESFFSNLAQNNDRDHDGVWDEEENTLGTDPDNPDSDGDGLNDGEEEAYMTNPLVKDTDGDTFSDYDEIQAGSDPLDPNSIPSAPIPTLNEWGIILFGLLLLGSMVFVLRKRRRIF